jgi:tRNA nucleotidyltransferase/poly(A) polymerase
MTPATPAHALPAFPPDLHDLRRALGARGHGLWVVGGYVRDLVLGVEPKDVDLCTDATPDEQVALYAELGMRHVPTGFAHGTVTVVLSSVPYEVTSLRRDVTTDGRHAVVAYTRDRVEDLARRDLTANAMSMDLEGRILDPFGGADDLRAGRVRFVGNPADRMREDHLRVLRWLRFHGRLTPSAPLDPEAAAAAAACAPSLARVSSERVWSEVSRILTGPGAVAMMRAVADLGLGPHLGLPEGSPDALSALARQGGGSDAPLMAAAYLGYDPAKVEALAKAWRWSRADADRAAYVSVRQGAGRDPFREMALDGRPLDWAVALARADGQGHLAKGLREWTVPAFPVDGRDLAGAGLRPGPAMGEALRGLRTAWADSGYALGADALLARLTDAPEGPPAPAP